MQISQSTRLGIIIAQALAPSHRNDTEAAVLVQNGSDGGTVFHGARGSIRHGHTGCQQTFVAIHTRQCLWWLLCRANSHEVMAHGIHHRRHIGVCRLHCAHVTENSGAVPYTEVKIKKECWAIQ